MEIVGIVVLQRDYLIALHIYIAVFVVEYHGSQAFGIVPGIVVLERYHLKARFIDKTTLFVQIDPCQTFGERIGVIVTQRYYKFAFAVSMASSLETV